MWLFTLDRDYATKYAVATGGVIITRYTDYDPFAWVYNKEWGEHTLKFCPMLEAVVLPKLPPEAHMLDLCCGTGRLAHWLTERGYHVTGIDGSEAMLNFARENAPEAEFITADAREFTLPPAFHAVISTFDSLNHILDPDELTLAFRNAHAALKPGGMLFFDMNTRSGYFDNWPRHFKIVEDDHVCVWRTHYDDDTRMAYWDMTMFRLQDTWVRTDFQLIQRAYEENEIHQALTAAGFVDILVFDDQHCPEGIPTLQKGRAFFLAKE